MCSCGLPIIRGLKNSVRVRVRVPPFNSSFRLYYIPRKERWAKLHYTTKLSQAQTGFYSAACSLQTYVNTLAGKEVNSSYPARKFSLHLSARLIFKSCRASDAISTADFRKRLLVSINKFYCVIDRHIIRSILITLLERFNNCTPLFKFLHFVEYEEKKNKIADFFLDNKTVHLKLHNETRW